MKALVVSAVLAALLTTIMPDGAEATEFGRVVAPVQLATSLAVAAH